MLNFQLRKIKILGGALLVLAAFSSCRSKQDWSDIFMKKGRQYADRGQFEPAVVEYEKAIRINRLNQKAYLESAELFYKMRQYKNTIEMINVAGSIPPEMPAYYEALKGDALASDNQIFEALMSYVRAVQKDSSNVAYVKKRDELKQKARVISPNFLKLNHLED